MSTVLKAGISLLLLFTAAFALPERVAAQQGGGMPVAVIPVVEREIPPSIKLVGTVLADKSAVVAAEVSGLLAAFDADEGQFLKQGEMICRIDPTMAELRLAEARSRLGSLRATLEELENGTRPEELRRLKAAVDEAQAIFEKWAFERKRITDLFERNQSSAKEKHDTEMEYLAADRRLTQARAAWEVAVNGPRKEELERARYDVAAQQAAVKRLQRDLAKTRIRAPFDGFVVAKRTEVGEWIDAGGPVCEMLAMETVKVRVDVPESAIPFARAGRETTVEIEALSKTLPARISRVIPRATPAARTFPVEIDLPNAEHTILTGMFVWAYVPAGPAGKRLLVHKDAVVARGHNKSIYVIRPGRNGGKMAVPVPVTTGLEIGGEIEIRAEGIAPGDLVVSRANERLYGPTPVTPMPPAASQPAARTKQDEPAASPPS